ncbi:MAG: RebB family R body protein [Alphaproteobacteria bacterium]|nr:RebB family R body protein [Alphaproteobacteria bacterium]
MAEIVNPQITDAVTQANVKVLAEGPAMAMGSIYQALAHSQSILFANMVAEQQRASAMANDHAFGSGKSK